METVIWIIVGTILLYPLGKIAEKAGYSFWWCIPATIPIFTILFLYIFAFRKWPLEKEVIYWRNVDRAFSKMNSNGLNEELKKIKDFIRSETK